MRLGITIALLAAALGISALGSRRYPDSLAAPLETISNRLAGWSMADVQMLDSRTLQAVKPSSYLARRYTKGNDYLSLFVAYYEQQRAGESMHSPKACLPAGGWEIWKYQSATIPVNGQGTTVNKYFIQKGGERMVVLYWYQSKGRVIASEYLGKLLLIRDALADGHTAGGLVRVMVADEPGLADQALQFSAELIPQVQRCFSR